MNIEGLWLLPTTWAVIILLCVTHFGWLRRWQRLAGEIAAALLVAALPFILVVDYSWPAKALLVATQIWLLLAPLRLLFGRLDAAFLRESTWLNACIGFGLSGAVVLCASAAHTYPAIFNYTTLGLAASLAMFAAALVFVAQTVWTLEHYRLRPPSKPHDFKQLPTVSVCIPARNEDAMLTECLEAVLASDYPKLEVIVLDDCSQDSTAQIVRAFAQRGVQFIQGDVPAEGWLGKNQALQTLSAQAAGDVVLFADVDTRLSTVSISHLVDYALANQAQMISVLPQNTRGLAASTVMGTLQYFWQIVLPVTSRRAPVSSKLWLINADVLRHLGGFASVRHKIVPEGSFARRLISAHSYRFIISNAELGVTEQKKWRSQVDTSLRLLYPTFKRQPFYALAGMAAMAGMAAAPFAFSVALAFFSIYNATFWLSLTAAFGLLVSCILVAVRTHPRTWFVVALFMPLRAIQEAILLLASMLVYEFGWVDWKGRNVCYPVISVTPGARPRGATEPVTQSANRD